MSKVYLIVKHPQKYMFLGAIHISPFYEIVKVVGSRKEGNKFCKEKNENRNAKYHYAVKMLEVG